MGRSMSWTLVTFIFQASSLALAAASVRSPASSFLEVRDPNTCGGSSNTQSCGPLHPSNWCCPTNTQCLSLNNTGTDAVLCCPNGNNCNAIQTITCNITLQNASKFPDSFIHIANLTQTLPPCGNQCCPLGFSCQPNPIGQGNICQIKDQTKAAPTGTSTSLPTSTSTSSSTSSTSKPAAGAQSSSPTAKKSNKKGVIAGVVITLLILAALVGAGYYYYFLRNRRQNEPPEVPVSSHRRDISEPIYNPQLAARTDFASRNRPRDQMMTSTSTSPPMNSRPSTAQSPISPLAHKTRGTSQLQNRVLYPPPGPRYNNARQDNKNTGTQRNLKTSRDRLDDTNEITKGVNYKLPNVRYRPD